MAVNLGILLGAKGGPQTRGEIDDTTGSVKRLDNAAGGAGKGGLATLSNALLSGVKMAAMAALTGITALGAGIIKSTMAAGDMEQKVADIASVMGLAKNETAPLASLIKDLGIDPKLKVTATEAGVAIENLAKNGLGMTDILNGAARSTVLLANATNADFGTAANVATDVMSLFKIKAEDMKSAVDGITSVTIASKFGIQDYALALSQGGGVASAVGVEFADFNTSIAAISSYFASGSDAGTSFKTMLQNMIPKSQEAEDLMKQLGLMTADGANAFFDASGNMKSMGDISALLASKLGGLSEEQKNSALSTLFGSDAMRAAFGLMESGQVVYTDAATAAKALGVSQEAVNAVIEGGITKYEALQLQMAKGDAEKSAATRMDTFKGALEILGGVFETLQIGIGEKFLPLFRQLIDRATKFLSDNADGIIAWAGELATQLEGLITNQLPAIIAKLSEWWTAGKQVVDSIRQFGLMETIWRGLTNLVSVAASALREWMGVMYGQIVQGLPGWMAKLGEWSTAAWRWIVEATPVMLRKLGEWVAAAVGWLGEHLPDMIATFLEWSTAAWRWIGDSIPDLIAGFADWLTAILTWDEQSGSPGLGQMVGEWVGTLLDWIWNDLIPKVGPALLDLGIAMIKALGKIAVELGAAALKLGASIIIAIAEGLAELAGVDLNLGEIKKTILTTIDGWRSAIFGAGADLTRRIGEGIRSLINDPQGAISSVIDNARGMADWLLNQWGIDLSAQGSAAVRQLQAGVAAVKDAVKAEVATTLKDIENYGLAQGLGMLAGRMYEAARQALVDFAKGFTTQAPNAKADLQTILDGVSGAIQNGLNGINSFITNWAGPAATKFNSAAKDLIGKFLDGWNSMVFDLGKWTSGITGSLAAWIVNGASDFKNAGLNLITSFLGGWSSASFDLSRWLNDGIGGTLSGWLNLNLNSINQWAGGIGRAIVDGIGAGITSASSTLQSALTALANLLPQWVKDVLGIHSPSTVFRAIGQNIVQGLTQGVQDLAIQPQIAINSAISGMAPAADSFAQQGSVVNNSSSSNVTQNYFTIAERSGGQVDLAERVRLLNMMYA